MIWKNRRCPLDLTHRGVVMGILNVTPDSFSDGGQHEYGEAALARSLQMVDEGAEIIDIGGESTRPGAEPVSVELEMERTVPVIKALRNVSEVLISIDTSKPQVAAAAIEAGADIVNDVAGCRDEEMISLCADSGVGVCVMHMQGEPRTMQDRPDYEATGGVLESVRIFFEERLDTLTRLGIDSDCLCFDPGIGFGKSLDHNCALMAGLAEIHVSRPILLGVSRKSCIGQITGEDDPEKRDYATAAVTALACRSGVRVHRVHNVLAGMHALKMAERIFVNY